jgi:TonB family protein
MSAPTVLWKKWEGRLVEEQFPLLQSLGSSEHSSVFLTERPGSPSQKLAVKLFPANGITDDTQLTRWESAAKLSHPHLLQLFECGRCQLDGTHFLFVVMEYAEENLAEILPLRPLAPAEASDILPPVLDVLSFLHREGYAHGRIKPSNIMAVGEKLKISADSLCKIGDQSVARAAIIAPSSYDAPELATTGPTPAADIWSLGVTLIAVLTQSVPHSNSFGQLTIPETIPQPLHEILRRCLQANPNQRCTVEEIRKQLQPAAVQNIIQTQVPIEAKSFETKPVEPPAHAKPSRWLPVSVVIAVLLLAAWIGVSKFGSRLMTHSPQTPAVQTAPATQTPETPPTQTPAPFSQNGAQAQKKVAGSVLHQVMPEPSRSAQNTITGTLKVSVQVSVDASGDVSQANFVSPGPSRYFANQALAAARRWKFTPPQLDGQPTASEWVLRFQFKRTSVQAFPAQVSPDRERPEKDKTQKVRHRR